MKKVWKFLGSMRFAILLLVILAAACAVGSFIPQLQPYETYAETYSPRLAGLIVGLGLDDVFHSGWFLALTIFLCGNLLLCNLTRLPQLVRRYRAAADPEQPYSATVQAADLAEPEPIFAKLGMPKPRAGTDAQGSATLFSVKNRIGLWGAWVCHLGILLLILGFVLGQMTKEEYTVYGVPGQTLPIADTGYTLTIRDFRIDRQDDGFATQYASSVTVSPPGAPEQAQQAEIGVNQPGSLFGFKLYQNSTGDAARLTVKKDGELVQENWVCVGDGVRMLDTPLALYLRACVPDYDQAADGSAVPGYAYQIYIEDQFYTMDVQLEGQSIPYFTPYEVRFSDPTAYTLIQVKRDRFALLALLGGVVTMLGLLLAFYLQLKQVWAVQQPDGRWTVYGACPKGGVLFAGQLRQAAGLPATPDPEPEPEPAPEPETAPDQIEESR